MAVDGVKSEFLKVIDLMSYFFVSRPASGRREGFEYQRVMYFNPETENLSKQTDVTGVAEAFIAFTSNFNQPSKCKVPEYDYRFVKSTKLLEVFLQVENGEYIIGLGLDREACKRLEYFVHMPSIKALVIRIYETFRLFYGTFATLFLNGRGTLMQQLDQFFSHYLSLLKVHQIPLIDLFAGVGFMSLSSVEYLDVQCLISRCSEQFPMIQKTVFLYQDKLVQYSVAKDDIIVIFRYLTRHLVQSAVQSELKPIDGLTRDSNKKYVGKFITGAVEFIGQETPKDNQFPTVYLYDGENGGTMVQHALIVYRALNATFCLFVKVEDLAKLDLGAMQQVLDGELVRLASTIGDTVSAASKPILSSSDIPFHYVYYNPDSLSLKTSLVESPSTSNNAPIPPASIYRQVCETFDHFIETNAENFAQVEVKADDDWWIIVKKVNGRILMLFVPSTASTSIVDMHEIVEQIIKSYFQNFFIL